VGGAVCYGFDLGEDGGLGGFQVPWLVDDGRGWGDGLATLSALDTGFTGVEFVLTPLDLALTPVEVLFARGAVGWRRCGLGREEAEFWMEIDLFDDGLVGVVVALGVLVFGQVCAGDLEAVEEQAGAFGVDGGGGKALEDLGDGCLNGAAIFWDGQLEGVGTVVAIAEMFGGAAGGVVVVAEVLATQAWAAATVAIGKDVTALVACRYGVG
jgi:hypothetical protein